MAAGFAAMLLSSTVFYIAAIRFRALQVEGRPEPLGAALLAVPGLLLPSIAVVVVGYVGVLGLMMLFVVPGVVMALSWSVALPVMVNERTGILGALGRSRALAMGSRGRILVAGLLMLVLTILLSVVTNLVMRGLMSDSGPLSVVLVALQGLATTASGMVHASFFASLYVELRRVREGFAVPTLAEVFA